ncbi:pyridoxamine 5'-phosphate oxidase family protein [Flavisolibacter ginsenosidimutans]|uniref:Pyridoxamine 5'-phosphate oxidase family protein n=1 Tax=Flavisolibacter ginsenosidimutans TaxID=661481 RepID=A0A5B8UG30_9BACT|nr:pyridoxamine 5'-phosphate oxidase family protein [Flavisolibacter ginsenosidimutans]QEC55362.1 pyridoxamine 5'-phosphate oxidase family protein [Flavisolibacter ginsenosidimutans]
MEKHLQDKEALNKFKKLVEDIRVCMFITATNSDEHTRPMSTIKVEDDGTLWFFTDVRSIKVDEVTRERDVHLTYAHPGKESYLDVWGKASVVTDRQQIKEKWSPVVKAWFPKGDEDPNLALLKIKPADVYYWDAESGKMVQFFKMAVAAVTGNPAVADGKEGKLAM